MLELIQIACLKVGGLQAKGTQNSCSHWQGFLAHFLSEGLKFFLQGPKVHRAVLFWAAEGQLSH